MEKTFEFGQMNGHAVGIIMKEGVRRAIGIIRSKRFTFEAENKIGYSGQLDDYVTDADREAQKMYIRMLRECFPGFGILAEESYLRQECTIPGENIYFTVDPLDGTKAFKRRQSHGIGTMISLVRGNEIIAACVGDVMSQEIYYYRPDSKGVHRVTDFGHVQRLVPDTDGKLSDLHVLLRTRSTSSLINIIVGNSAKPSIFKDVEMTGGSIGSSMARLWKGEVGVAVLNNGFETPWDSNPVIGISRKLGFCFLKITDARTMEMYEPVPVTEVTERKFEALVIHESRLTELAKHVAITYLAPAEAV